MKPRKNEPASVAIAIRSLENAYKRELQCLIDTAQRFLDEDGAIQV